jgi:hypothetical protein
VTKRVQLLSRQSSNVFAAAVMAIILHEPLDRLVATLIISTPNNTVFVYPDRTNGHFIRFIGFFPLHGVPEASSIHYLFSSEIIWKGDNLGVVMICFRHFFTTGKGRICDDKFTGIQRIQDNRDL